MFTEKIIDETVIYDGPIFRVEHLSVKLDDGSEAWRDVVRHNGGVCVAAIDGDYVYMVEQYRISVGRTTLELPAGKLEARDTPESGARRELQEECGLATDNLVYLGSCLPSPGYTSEVLHLYLAQDLVLGKQALDEGEFLRVFKIHLSDVMDWIMNGKIEDAKTIICLFKAREYVRRQEKEAEQA